MRLSVDNATWVSETFIFGFRRQSTCMNCEYQHWVPNRLVSMLVDVGHVIRVQTESLH